MTGSAMPPAVVAEAAAAAKAWLRAPMDQAADGGDDETIASLAASALALAEAFCARAFVARPFAETLAAGPPWRPLGAAPVTAITAVTDGGGAALPVDAYAIDVDAAGIGWLRLTRPCGELAVTVGYTAGDAADWATLPAPVAQGIVMLVAHLFDQRDAGQAPPAAVAALWRPWRRMALAPEQRR